jgi:predicted Fe-Mo cluster-binding NifX family protein
MKIAVPVTVDNQISGHFGQSDSYGVFTISDSKEITEIKTVESPKGCGCKSDLASSLSTEGVTVMLASGIGDGAVNNLNNNGIEVIRGCSGNATEVVKLFISGLVEDTGNSCDHHAKDHGHHNHEHDHGHEHNCGSNDHHNHGDDHGHAHSCGHGDHHNHEHGHELVHNCGCN